MNKINGLNFDWQAWETRRYLILVKFSPRRVQANNIAIAFENIFAYDGS